LEGPPGHQLQLESLEGCLCLAHLKRQHQLQVSGVESPLGSAHAATPAPAATIGWLGTALDNFALGATNNTTIPQQLTASNLAHSSLVTILTAANKKLAEVLTKEKPTSPPAAMPVAPWPVQPTNMPFPGNYCWTPHGHQCSQHHTSVSCGNKAAGHKDNATAANRMDGSEANKGWNTRT
jgi:hypothetical protein